MDSFSLKSFNYFNALSQFDKDIELLMVSASADTHGLALLIKAGANVNITDKETGNSALMYATANGFFQNVRALLNAGAKPDVVNKHFETALSYAILKKQVAVINLLFSFMSSKQIAGEMKMNELREYIGYDQDLNIPFYLSSFKKENNKKVFKIISPLFLDKNNRFISLPVELKALIYFMFNDVVTNTLWQKPCSVPEAADVLKNRNQQKLLTFSEYGQKRNAKKEDLAANMSHLTLKDENENDAKKEKRTMKIKSCTIF